MISVNQIKKSGLCHKGTISQNNYFLVVDSLSECYKITTIHTFDEQGNFICDCVLIEKSVHFNAHFLSSKTNKPICIVKIDTICNFRTFFINIS